MGLQWDEEKKIEEEETLSTNVLSYSSCCKMNWLFGIEYCDWYQIHIKLSIHKFMILQYIKIFVRLVLELSNDIFIFMLRNRRR